MRLNKYIHEAKRKKKTPSEKAGIDIYEDIISILEKNCSKIIKTYKSTNGFLVRGIQGEYDNPGGFKMKEHTVIKELKMRKGVRKPRNTNILIHRELNKLFKEKFGWKVRDGIFTMGSFTPGIYGREKLFFPINRFKFVWSPKFKDLYSKLPSQIPFLGSDMKPKEWVASKRKTWMRKINTFKDTDLESAIKSRNEVAFKCSKYWLVDKVFEMELREHWGMSPR